MGGILLLAVDLGWVKGSFVNTVRAFPQNRQSKIPQFLHWGSAGLNQQRSFRGRSRVHGRGAGAAALLKIAP